MWPLKKKVNRVTSCSSLFHFLTIILKPILANVPYFSHILKTLICFSYFRRLWYRNKNVDQVTNQSSAVGEYKFAAQISITFGCWMILVWPWLFRRRLQRRYYWDFAKPRASCSAPFNSHVCLSLTSYTLRVEGKLWMRQGAFWDGCLYITQRRTTIHTHINTYEQQF